MKKNLLLVALALLVTNGYGQNTKRDLVASYSFTGNLDDLSGNNFHGLGNSILLTTDRNGVPNSAAYFNGVNSHIVIPHDSLINRTQWTYMAWVAADANATTSTIFSVGGATNSFPGDGFEQGMSFINSSTPMFFAGGYNQGNNPVQSQVFGNTTKVQWHHMVATRNGQKISLYIDGVPVVGTPTSNINGQLPSYGNSASKRAVIGSIARLGEYYFKGKIDEVNLYKTALNAADIDSVYKSYFVKPKDAPIMLLFNNNTIDSGIFSQHGTNHGAQFVTDRFGNQNMALSFNGINSHVTLPYDSLLNLNEYTYSAWIKVDSSLQSSATIVSVGGATNLQPGDGFEQGMSFVIDTNESFFGGSYNYGDNPNQSKIFTSSVKRNTWNHVTYVRASDSVRIYLNGNKQSTQPSAVVNNQLAHYGNSINKRAVIGSIARLGEYYFKGEIDDVYLYMKALDSSEVAKLYNSFPPFATNVDTLVIAHYPFNGSYNDTSGNNLHATNFGSTFVDDRYGNPLSSIYFNGVQDYVLLPNNTLINRNDYTVSLWVATSPFQNSDVYILSGGGASNQGAAFGFNQGLQYSHSPYNFYKGTSFNKNGNPIESTAKTDSINKLVWHHIILTRDSSNMKIFIDGQLSRIDTTNQINGLAAHYGNDSIKRVILGSVSWMNGNYFNGYIDDLTILSRALDSVEAINLYNSYSKYLAVGNDPNTGLQANYPLDGNGLDFSINLKHGNVVGAQPTIDRFGQLNSAMYFDGIDDYITIPTETIVDAEVYAISAWIKPENNNSQNFTIFSAGGATNQNGGDGFEQGLSCINFNNNSLSIFGGGYNHGQTPLQSQIESKRILQDQWHHVAYVRTPQKIRLFVDGEEAAQTPMSVVNFQHAHYGYAINKRAVIGSIARLGEYYYKGSIDDLKIFKGALSDSQIMQLFDPTGTNNNTPTNSVAMSIYPNPSAGNFSIKSDITNSSYRMQLVNCTGQIIYDAVESSGMKDFNFEGKLNPGLYLIKIQSLDGTNEAHAKIILN